MNEKLKLVQIESQVIIQSTKFENDKSKANEINQNKIISNLEI